MGKISISEKLDFMILADFIFHSQSDISMLEFFGVGKITVEHAVFSFSTSHDNFNSQTKSNFSIFAEKTEPTTGLEKRVTLTVKSKNAENVNPPLRSGCVKAFKAAFRAAALEKWQHHFFEGLFFDGSKRETSDISFELLVCVEPCRHRLTYCLWIELVSATTSRRFTNNRWRSNFCFTNHGSRGKNNRRTTKHVFPHFLRKKYTSVWKYLKTDNSGAMQAKIRETWHGSG